MNLSELQNYLPKKPTRIAVGMSGGVDSNTTAYLLHQLGHEVVGFTAWTLNGPGKCCNDALINAGRVCDQLGIQYDTVDLRAEFAHYVMDYYENSYQAGLTPNPCVECNRFIKWEKLVDYARESLDCEYVATGHYAQIHYDCGLDGKPLKNTQRVFRSVDERKDQTYMMARVRREDFAHALFPLGHLTKPQVRDMAREANLPEADGKESQDVCFVLDGQQNYLKRALGSRSGPIIDLDQDKVLGEHEGSYLFTIGQRKGVNVSANRPVYVVKIDPKTNTVYVGDKGHLDCSTFTVLKPMWLPEWLEEHFSQDNSKSGLSSSFSPSPEPISVMAKIRYNTPPAKAKVFAGERPDTLVVQMEAPVSAVTPGQVCAFYDPTNTVLYGGGYIESFLSHRPFDPAEHTELPDLNGMCPV